MLIKRAAVLACILGSSPLLAGCVSLAGAPERVFSPADSMGMLNNGLRYQEAIEKFFSPCPCDRNELSPRQFRDMVVTLYLNAMDAKYSEFRTALSSEGRQAALGLDLAVIGLTGWASVAKDTMAKRLSAAAAGYAGARGAIDKTLYYDKSLPALLSAMDAQRLRIKTQILLNLRKDEKDYPLPTAFADLMGYEVAVTLDTAVEEITKQASDAKSVAQAEYDTAVKSCSPKEDVSALLDKIYSHVRTLATANPMPPANLQELRVIALTVGASPDGDADALGEAITDKLVADGCKKAEIEGWIARIKTLTGRTL